MNTPPEHDDPDGFDAEYLGDWRPSDGDPAPDPPWRPRLADRINTWWIDREPTWPALREMAGIPPRPALAGILAALVTALTTAVLILWWLITAVVALVAGIGDAITATAHHAGNTGAEHITTAGLTRIITDPVHTYLTSHAAGLPIDGHTLWITWLATTGGLFLLAALGSRGARIGWTLTGALTAAMVYTATPALGRPVAAGLAVTAWAVLSVVALNRLTGGSNPPVLRLHLPARRPARPSTND